MSFMPMNQDEYGQPVLQDISRQRKLADQLRAQSEEPLNGQMVSGIYVAPSWSQYLAKGLKSYQAGQTERDASKKETDYYNTSRQRNADELGKIAELLTGKQAITLPQGQQGPTRQAVAPDMTGAYQFAVGSQNPALQQFGLNGALSQAQKQADAIQANNLRQQNAALWQKVGGNAAAFINAGGDPNIAKEFANAPLLGKDEGVVVNGQLVGKHTGEAIGKAVPKQVDYSSDLLIPDPNNPGKMIPNTALVGIKKDIANSGRNLMNTQVSVAGPENQYNKDIGAGLAKSGLELVQIAQGAPKVIDNARMIRSALDKGAITGTGADSRLALQKALETVGLIGQGKAANTQQLISGLANITLSGVKTSGLGAGNGFTDKDREFLNSAISGQISDTPQNLRRVADLSERVALANHKNGTQVLNRWKSDPSLKNVAQDFNINPVTEQEGAWGIKPVGDK